MKKTLILLLTIVIIISFTFSSHKILANDESTIDTSDEIHQLEKDETIYVNLNYDGSVSQINVVNRIDTQKPGIYTDMGVYTDITNLTGSEVPDISDDKITWQLPARDEGFYYQGTLETGELPFNFDISYRFNGKEVNPEKIIGESGKVEIKLNISSNDKARDYFKNNYLCQVQLPLSLDTSHGVLAEDASTMIIGRTLTLAYMVLPGNSGQYSISYETRSFELDNMTITCSYFDDSSIIDIDTDEIKDGIADMSDGTSELISGTEKLQKGMRELHSGVSQLSSGASQLEKGVESLNNGIHEYTSGAETLAQNMNLISNGLAQLSEQGPQLIEGYEQLSAGLLSLIEVTTPLLSILPQEEQMQYMHQLEVLKEEVAKFQHGLSAYSEGVSRSAKGVYEYSERIKEFAKKGSDLKSGALSINNGISGIASGLHSLANNTSTLPNDVEKLIDGQRQLKEGIDEASELFDTFDLGGKNESIPVSFVSDDITPRSVQFVINTPELKTEAEEVKSIDQKEENKGLWDRILGLFRR